MGRTWYYNRARNLKAAAQTIVEEYGGQLPADYDKLLSLKGIGMYTAGAIGSIAFELQVPAVDGNVLRVLTRLWGDDSDILKDKTKKAMGRRVMEFMPEDRPGDFNQALIELGATVCVRMGSHYVINVHGIQSVRHIKKISLINYRSRHQRRQDGLNIRLYFY